VIRDPRYQDFVANVNPGTWEIVQELRDSTWPGGALFGCLGEFRNIVKDEMNAMLSDSSYTLQDAVRAVAERTNEQIWLYNMSN